MEIHGFLEYLYILKKNYNFKTVHSNYSETDYKVVLWAIPKNKKVKDGTLFKLKDCLNLINGDYDICQDNNIETLIILEKINGKKVILRPNIEVWIDIACKIIETNITIDAKKEKLYSIIRRLGLEERETFILKVIYGFNSSLYNATLLNILLSLSNMITDKEIIPDSRGSKHFTSHLCSFYDKFRFKFSEEENLFLWINLIQDKKSVIIDSMETHAIANYLKNSMGSSEKEQLYSFFPLLKEKDITKNNGANPFEFQEGKIHRRFIFEFHNEQMIKTLQDYYNPMDSSWGYSIFKIVADKILEHLANIYNTNMPQPLSKATDTIYSNIVYADSWETVNLYKELALIMFHELFIDLNLDDENKDILLEDSRLEAMLYKNIIAKNITPEEMNHLNCNSDDEPFFKL